MRRALAAVALALGLGACGDDAAPEQRTERAERAERVPALPPPPPSALRIGTPTALAPSRTLSHWAPVRRPVAARTRPTSRAPTIARLSTRTPEATTNLVSVLARRTDAGGRLWLRVRLPVLPNDTAGWVPRTALGGLEPVTTHLVVDRRRLQATLLRDGRPVFRAPVAIGASRWPTPAGRFYVRNKLTRFRSPTYGPLAYGTSARSATLTDWPAGGFVGIHGTDRPDLIPGRVSHGCIRLRNPDLLRLARLMPVGTPLTIR